MRDKYNIKDSANVYLLAVLVPLIVSFFLSIVLEVVSLILKIDRNALLSNIWVYAGLLLCTQGTLLLTVLIYNKTKKIKTKTAVTLDKKVSVVQIMLVLIMSVSCLFLFLPLVNLFDSFIRAIGYNNSGSLPFEINSIPSLIIGLIFLALLPAVCEEFVFRGVVYNGIKNGAGAKKAVIFSAVCFCIIHMSLQQTVYPLLLGVVLALIVYYTGSIKSSIIAHFVNNAIVVFSNYIASFSTQQVEQATFEINLSNIISVIVSTIIGVLVIIACCFLLKKLNENKIKKQQNNNINELESTVEQEDNTENIATQQEDKTQKDHWKTFYTYLIISLVFWILENIAYF